MDCRAFNEKPLVYLKPMNAKFKLIFSSILVLSGIFFISSSAHAQQLVPEQITTMKAQVISVTSQKQDNVAGTGVSETVQMLDVKILDGAEQGKVITVQNGYTTFKVGDVLYLTHDVDKLEGMDMYAVADAYRLPWLYGLVGLFIICVLIFGGKQGFRGLIALALSFLAIAYLLFPGILHGFSPVLMSIGIASVMIILGSYITHGFNKVTTSAVIGMITTIMVTGLLAYISIHGAKLTGFASEESVYLNMDTNGSINFAGLLLGGIIIGLLGVLYDAAIGQAVAVDELHHVGPHLPRSVIFKRALRIGREHIGALVNILAIAYVGASLPLLLLFYQSSADFSLTINREIFATEIVRTMVGSIGLILAVPLTTLIAVFLLMKKKTISEDTAVIASEMRKVEEVEHKH